MFRRLRTRRAIKAAEKSSGLKQENSIFRGKKMTNQQQHSTIPTLTATFSSSEVSETDGTTSPSNYDISHMNSATTGSTTGIPYDVDITTTVTELYDAHQSSEPNSPETEAIQEQMRLMMQELESDHNEVIHEKNIMIQNLSQELDRTRQDFIDVIVDLNVKEQELSATKLSLVQTERKLEQVTKDLFAVKDQLHLHGATLIQYQHQLHLAQEELDARKQAPFGFLFL